MLATSHAFAGMVLAVKYPHQWGIIIGGSFLLHFIMDCVPHWSFDPMKRFSFKEFKRILPDLAIAFITYLLFLLRYPQFWFPITVSTFFVLLPDIIESLKAFSPRVQNFPVLKYFYYLHDRVFQWEINSPVIGILTQVIFIGGFVWWLLT